MNKKIRLLSFVFFAAVLVPAAYLVVVSSRSDPDGRRAFRELSQQLTAEPARKVFRITRISNYPKHFLDRALQEDRWNEYTIVYDRRRLSLKESGVNATQDWSLVTDATIHLVAQNNGTFADLGKYGALNVKL